MKKYKYVSLTNYFLSGLGTILLGSLLIIYEDKFYLKVIHLLLFFFLLMGFSKIITSFFKSMEKKKEKRIIACIEILIAILLFIFQNLSLSIVPFLFGIYLILQCLVKVINYILYKKNNIKGKWKELFFATWFLLFGVTFFFSPLLHLSTVLKIIGIYLILLGLGEWIQLLREVIPNKTKRKFKRSFRITLPAIVEAFLPKKMLREINRYINDQEEVTKEDCEIEKNDKKVDLEILIHLSEKGFNQFGHMDFVIDGTVISFGNYDKSSYRIGESIGDSVLFESPKDKYIPFCIKRSNKTIIGFGLSLTNKEKDLVLKEYEDIKKDVYSWDPPIKGSKKRKYSEEEKRKMDYASALYLDTNATFYKFKSGEFKSYFVLGKNCSAFADRIIGKSGTCLLKMSGILSPGTYLDYLEDEFYRKNSMVVSKTIYHKSWTDKEKITKL